jgi:hypothetical protein
MGACVILWTSTRHGRDGDIGMNWAWANSLDHLWRAPTFPMWLTLAAAGFFGLIVLATLLRAEKSVANGALTVITLLAIAVAGAAMIRGFGTPAQNVQQGDAGNAPTSSAAPVIASLPALSCIDELAGDAVLAGCEKPLFGSAEASAAAVSYAAAKINRLTSYGDVAAANKVMTPDLMALRHAVERDRYGLMAYVLASRDHCDLGGCPAYASIENRSQIAANMDAHTYESMIARYAPLWNAPPAAAAVASVTGLPPSLPTGKPTNADFPSSASIPPVSIMTPEPPLNARAAVPPSSSPNAQAAAPKPAVPAHQANAPNPAHNAAVPKKPAAPKPRPPAPAQNAPSPASAQAPVPAPVQLAPAPAAADN